MKTDAEQSAAMPPDGYTLLAAGDRCDCAFGWPSADGRFWCCRTAAPLRGAARAGPQQADLTHIADDSFKGGDSSCL